MMVTVVTGSGYGWTVAVGCGLRMPKGWTTWTSFANAEGWTSWTWTLFVKAKREEEEEGVRGGGDKGEEEGCDGDGSKGTKKEWRRQRGRKSLGL